MFRKVAAFEFRYQVTSPLFLVAASLFLVASFVDMSVGKMVSSEGGNVLYNSPHYLILSHLLVSLLFLFIGAAFVSNVIVRDDLTGFGPLIRSTRITKFDYLIGRFAGAFAAGALVMAAVPLGAWLGTLLPIGTQEMLGPNRLSGFVYGYGFFGLANALIISAILFALANATRSTAGTFVGVIALFILYLVAQRLMEGETDLQNLRVLLDPFGMAAYMASSRYFTAAELNAGAVPVSGLMVQSRLMWVGLSLLLLAMTYRLFRFSDRGMSRRQQRRLKSDEAAQVVGPLLETALLTAPSFGRRTAIRTFIARAGLEARFILTSPAFLILLLFAFALTLIALSTASGFLDVPLYRATDVMVPTIEAFFDTILIIIAAYFGGELVWRERERKINEIIDAAPLPAWALMLPKLLGLALVLLVTLLVGMAAGILVQLLDGAVRIDIAQYLSWYLAPGLADALLIAVLAVFVQALSPSKYAGWGVMLSYILLLVFGPASGLEHPMLIYGSVPEVDITAMAGTGNDGAAAWWFRLFWAAVALFLLLVVQWLWPRGAEQSLGTRLRRLRAAATRRTALAAAAALGLIAATGSWNVVNTLVWNDLRTGTEAERHFADLEKRYFHYASLPQPAIRHVEIDVALFPDQARAEVSGRYRLVNETGAPISELQLRLLDFDLELLSVDLPGARLERNDERFDYRIYRLDVPMQPGEARILAFRTKREQVGFRAANTENKLLPNGTDLNSIQLAPRIGMTDHGLIEDPATRRAYGLPERSPFPRLDDLAATMRQPNGDVSWTTADIRVSTSADQTPIAPGRRISDRVEGGRRVARFLSDTPIRNFFLVKSGRYALRSEAHDGITYSIYHHPEHHWNVERMMKAMRASIAYYREAFGPYQFDQVQVVERPFGEGGQTFPNMVAVSEGIFGLDLRDPAQLDMVSMLVAHELAHQWWGHQVTAARMQGAGLIGEAITQYSALMVLKRLYGEEALRPFFAFQRDRYLSERRTQLLEEQPLISASLDQDYVNYGKGALAFYLLQERMGEETVNRALRRFIGRYRFSEGPHPRSLDLVAMLREEARTAEEQALITDLFERITLFDLAVSKPTAVKRADGRWDVTVRVSARKFHANGKGEEKEVPLQGVVPLRLFTADPAAASFARMNVLRMDRQKVRSGWQAYRVVTDRKPTHAGIDLLGLYIDRNFADNVAPVGD
jgi:ABC-type transport system involved in multi-copper enzyme maturation permease subunit